MQSLVKDVFSTLRARDRITAAHCERVSKLAKAVAQQLNLPSEQVLTITYGALLHDLGKLDVPHEILHSSRRLTASERRIVEKHPIVGVACLKRLGFPREIVEIALLHHKKLDGSGYPEYEEAFSDFFSHPLSVSVQIVAACDIYEAVTSHRSYRKNNFTHDEAIALIRQVQACTEEIVAALDIEGMLFTNKSYELERLLRSASCRRNNSNGRSA